MKLANFVRAKKRYHISTQRYHLLYSAGLTKSLSQNVTLDYVHTMPVRRENGMKKLLLPFLFTQYRHFYRHKTMPVSKWHEMKT